MKKIALILVICMAAVPAVAQETLRVDYKEIEKMVAENHGYYDSLLGRFEQADTTLTLQELSLVYYGFSFLEGYSSFVFDREMSDAFSKGEFAEAETMAAKILEKNPVYLRANYIVACSKYEQNDLEWEKYLWRFGQLCLVITFSGDGESSTTAYKVICVADEYEILYKMLEVKDIAGQALTRDQCDAMSVVTKDGDKATIYFDVSRSLASLEKMFGTCK